MRPGYSVLIEWGWAPYLNNDKTLGTNIQFIDDVLNGGKSKEEIWKNIFTKASTDGNYEAIYGFIKNYSWKARPDGGYDCTTNIITMGEIIESLKVNYGAFDSKNLTEKGLFGGVKQQSSLPSSFQATYITAPGGLVPVPVMPDAVADSVSSAYSQNIIAGICAELYQIVVDNTKAASERYRLVDPETNYTYELLRNDIAVSGNQQSSITNNGITQVYILLESFIEILNKKVLLNDSKKPIAGLSIYESDTYSKKNRLLCLADIHQISTNPTVCLIRNRNYYDPLKSLGIDNLNTEGIRRYMDQMGGTYYDDATGFGVIGNIYMNLDYLSKLATNDTLASQDKKEKNDIVLFDFIKSMMSGANTAIGNVANFDIFVDPADSIARIIDVNYVDTTNKNEAYKNAFTIEIHNLKSTVRNYNLESQIFPDQVTTIAIGAQAKGGVLGSNTNTLIDFNQNLEDRIVPKKDSPLSFQNKPTDLVAEAKERAKLLQDNFANLTKYFIELSPSWFSKGDYDIEQSSKYANSLKDIINYYISIFKTEAKNRGIIPTKLSLEMDGIGGMIIGNMFRIPDELLPRGYKGGGAGPKQIAYLVTGLGHSIQNNDWITKVDAQFIILDEPKGLDYKTNLEIVKVNNRLASAETPFYNRQANNFIPFGLTNIEDSDNSGINFTSFVYPTTGKITSAFAVRPPIPGGVRGSEFHRALDIANVLNTPIYSICDGEVVRAGSVPGYGDHAIYIKMDRKYHNQNKDYYVVYGHNQAHYVKVGDKVSTGQKIADMGSQGGGSTGPHLHLQIRESAFGFDSSTTSLMFGKYFPQVGGTITALALWGTNK
jgi:murein DD-endopeptidase MepM/ murein hydrolase activator NlpD